MVTRIQKGRDLNEISFGEASLVQWHRRSTIWLRLPQPTERSAQQHDPNLTNGAGYGPYATQNWDNRVSRIIFLGGSYCY